MDTTPSFSTGPCEAGELAQLVRRQAAARPDAAAVLDAERDSLSYGRLASLMDDTAQALRELGVGAGDRVAMALPNGPEAATAFLAVAAAATAAPLNPAYRRSEFDFYLADLRAKILIVAAGVESPARNAAREAGVPVVELISSSIIAGGFTLWTSHGATQCEDENANSRDDVALVLHTSGTTARPKIVPLTQRNLLVSARNIAESLELTPSDRCLNVMPLFHIHGLVGALLSTLSAGGSVVCEPGFDAARALDTLERFQPTWYTAVPTMHQALLAAAAHAGRRPRHGLRLIRSCSSALPVSVMQRLEETFGVPVVEAYGMTEAAHQMTCNPLPPRARKPGSVGVPTGVAVAIMDAEGRLAPAGDEGEVVIRGANVTGGYEDNPQANFAAFEQGWFRTGDQGRLDDDGYLFLTGRIKELINRGGEKISPREIDEALLSHPDVAQAVAFALPHPTLGEDVAAAVVAKEGRSLDAGDVRRHVAARLADFKTPQRVLIVTEIPKGPTGKLQRIGLAEKLGLVGNAAIAAPTLAAADPPSTETERRLSKYWGMVLDAKEFHRNDGFFACGGDSLSATMLLALIEQHFHVALPIATLLDADTLADVAAVIDRLPRGSGLAAEASASLVPFRTAGTRPPLFMVHGHTGRATWLGLFTPHLDGDQPFYAFTARGLDGLQMPHRDLATMAAAYLAEVREVQPRGPYCLSGFCAGGLVAYEMAQQLAAVGERVAALVLVDTANPRHYARPPRWLYALRSAKLAARRAGMRVMLTVGRGAPAQWGERIVNETIRRGIFHYRPEPYAGRLVVLRSDTHPRTTDPHLGWRDMAAGGAEIRRIPGDHATLLKREHTGRAARVLQRCLVEAVECESTHDAAA